MKVKSNPFRYGRAVSVDSLTEMKRERYETIVGDPFFARYLTMKAYEVVLGK